MEPEPTDTPSDEQLADLARLADGTLPAGRRAEVEAQVAASPELSRLAERQAVAMSALQEAAARTGAPARLHAGVQRRRGTVARRRPGEAAGRRRRARGSGRCRPRPGPRAPGGRCRAARASPTPRRSPTAPDRAAPAGAPGTPQLLAAAVDNVPFPDYAAKFGWAPTGVRRDELSGRDATTVLYEKDDRTIAYTIVSGDALDPPSGARFTTRGGVEYHVFRHDGRAAVTWERGGRTCVLSGATVPATELVGLADWRGKGAIPF